MPKHVRLALQAAGILLAIVAIAVVPSVIELFALMQLTLFAAMAVLALSLAFIWGFGGILSFGQTAFFGLGAYTAGLLSVPGRADDNKDCLVTRLQEPLFILLICGAIYFIISFPIARFGGYLERRWSPYD